MRRPQIKIPEVEYYQKVSSDAQIWPQGAEKQQSKVNVVVVVVVVGVQGKDQYCSCSDTKIEIEIELRASQSLSTVVALGSFQSI